MSVVGLAEVAEELVEVQDHFFLVDLLELDVVQVREEVVVEVSEQQLEEVVARSFLDYFLVEDVCTRDLLLSLCRRCHRLLN